MPTTKRSSERGAILIQVGVAIIVLIAFTMFVVDYGIMWVSRSQAQNSADAGALAGAVALSYDDPDDYTPTGPAQVSARSVALNNSIFGGPPSILLDEDITFSRQTMEGFPPECDGANCIRVEVRRNQERANPLPMWFGPLVGLTEQGVRATAIAWVRAGNTADCLRPFAIPDLYTDTMDPPDGFDPGTDVYNPLGYTLAGNIGDEVALRQTDEDRVAPGWFRLLDLMGGGGGGTSDLRDVIRSCAADAKSVDDILTDDSGVKNGIKSAVDDLVALDPDAHVVDGKVVDSCAEDRSCEGYVWDAEAGSSYGPVADPGRNYSPRIIPLAIFDPAHMAATGEIKVVNFLGFFITDDDQWTGKEKYLRGIIVDQPGLFDSGRGNVDETSAFLKVIQLVR